MKTCPFCAEVIQDAAVKCRYCGSVLAGEPVPGAAQPGVPGRAAEPDGLPWTMFALAAAAILVIVAFGVGAGLVARWRSGAAATASSVPIPANVEPYSFGVRWGAPPPTVSMQLMGRGLAFTEHDEDGDQVYSGVVDGSQAVVIAMFARGGLGKVIVAYGAAADPAAAYEAAVKRLTASYGPPSSSPATRAAGRRPVASWPPRKDDTGDTRVWVTITDADGVAVHYESGGWKAEAERRRHGRS